MRSIFRVPALVLGAIVLLLLVLLTPLGGFFASVLTYNSWATFLILAWVIFSSAYVAAKARDEESRLFKVAFGGFWFSLACMVLFLISRAAPTDLAARLIQAETPAVRVVLEASKDELSPFLGSRPGFQDTLAATREVWPKDSGLILSDLQEINQLASAMVDGGVSEHYTYRPCQTLVKHYQNGPSVLTQGHALWINGYRVAKSTPSSCRFGFNQIQLLKN